MFCNHMRDPTFYFKYNNLYISLYGAGQDLTDQKRQPSRSAHRGAFTSATSMPGAIGATSATPHFAVDGARVTS